ncbi:MAG: metallopeptidase TldD-related protein [Anaerolineales bacterium]|jgi:PmbA protein
MLESIIQSLRDRDDLKAWSVRHIQTRGAQQYDLQDSTESKRSVEDERFVVNVLRETSGPDGSPACGASTITILPGGDIDSALDSAALMAGLVHNQPYDFPTQATQPEIDLTDEGLKTDPATTAQAALSTLKDVVSDNSQVRLTAGECFAEREWVHLVSSSGIDATQESTKLDMEWVFMAGEGEQEVEAFAMMTRRRAADLQLEMEAGQRVQQAADLLIAGPPPSHKGPVVIRGATLATVLNSDVLQTLSAASMKYTGETQWEIGKSIFRGEVKGDALNVWANRQLAYGVKSNRFDAEGIPAQRVELIRNNVLVSFWASQRFAEYLDMPATGQFGDIEIAPGSTPSQELLAIPHVEIVEFSWFNPNTITGDFSCEIRLGYVVDGEKRTPFKGGMLVGNLLDALADVRWSSEVDFYGNYLGPTTALFNELVVVGED